jgi:hypothetical protein
LPIAPLAALAQLPGVQSVALTSVTPLTGETWVDNLSRPDHPVPGWHGAGMINVRWINPELSVHHADSAGRRAQHHSRRSRQSLRGAHLGEGRARGFPGEESGRTKDLDLVPDDKHPSP